jgi:hypothetical protein
MRQAARYRGKYKSGSLHESRRITRFQCPNLSEKTIGRFYGSCFGEPSSRARGRQNRLIRIGHAHAQIAKRLLQQSYDKRYAPSTFIEETADGYQVGWFDHQRKHLQHFAEFSQAAADYLLFSFGKGRLRCQTI